MHTALEPIRKRPQPAPARQNLRLEHHIGDTELLGHADAVGLREGDAGSRHRDLELAQQLVRDMLVDVEVATLLGACRAHDRGARAQKATLDSSRARRKRARGA
eukprot:Amastigsp_a1441_206.p7 type:complete len:104 gc:universal Amastigsp_a1441_206:1001-1312(+)